MVAAFSIAGCQSAPEGATNEVAPGTTAKPVDIAAPNALPRVDRRLPTGDSVDDHEQHTVDDLRVEWPAPAAIDTAAFARLRLSEQQKIEAAPVPVLVPKSQGLIENLEIIVRSHFVAASGDGTGAQKGVHVFVSATKLAHRYSSHKPIERTHTVRSRPGWVLQNEGIWSANWEENGVSYLAEVECTAPGTDARCANSDYLMKLTNELAFVGGSFDRSPSPGDTAGGDAKAGGEMKASAIHAVSVAVALTGVLAPASAMADDFSYNPPGSLVPGSGDGRVDEKVYAPAMRFPIEEGPAFANSQVWGIGGSEGPAGSQCSEGNFSYPWSDNYCETRSWDMPLCPAGVGHQGQDIRASTCDKNVHWVVAAESGTVTNVGSYSVYITAADGTRYDYLHMGSVQVAVGDDVEKGSHIGKVSNEFGGTPTSVHLHFNLRQNVDGVGNVYVPPYMSLITAYQALVGPPPVPAAGALETVACEGLVGFTQSPATPDEPIDVRFTFDGAAGEPDIVGYPFLADLARDDLCETLGSCNHAFDVPPPLSLFDGAEHQVHAYASDGSASAPELGLPELGLPELGTSPQAFTCSFAIPSGVRRKIRDVDSANAWRFSPFWDEIGVSDGIIGSVDEGSALPDVPRLVASDAEPEVLFVIDGDKRRAVVSPAAARAWDLDARYAELLSADDLAAFPQGADLGPRPYVLRSASGELWLVDAPEGQAPGGSGGGGAGGGSAEDDDGGDGCSCRLDGRPTTPTVSALTFLLLSLLARRSRSRHARD